MFKFTNSIVNLISSVGDQLGSPKNNSLWKILGNFFGNLPMFLLNLIWFLIQSAMKFVLNLVDLMQYFVKHLVGIDYWEGEVSLDTVGDSDVIFKFLYNTNVQRVFRYMVGVFIVLLIVFSIVAIIRNEYAVASEADKASNDSTTVLKRAGKAILMVVLVPVLLVFGLLASNAILASLVNAFNINNRLSLGNQVFVASSYEGNRYRLYADNNLRYGMNNKVNVYLVKNGEETIIASYNKARDTNYNDGEVQTFANLTAEQVIQMKGSPYYHNIASKQITVSINPINPRNYSGNNYFIGFAFNFKGTTYLMEVSTQDLNVNISGFSGWEFYYHYLTDMLGATVLKPSEMGAMSYEGMTYVIKARLHDYDDDTALVQAAYNSWNYNSLFLDDQKTFDNTQKKIKDVFLSDSGRTYANAVHYTNNDVWGILHDGGYTGNYVALRDEYYVMADVLDFMVSNGLQLAIVNINNPYIKWTYNGEGGYLKTAYVNAKRSGGAISGIEKFAVNYVNDGIATYYNNGEYFEESKGAIYIMAYYNGSEYIPLVNNAEYTDSMGSYTFSSSYLENDYSGLIVARGILQGTYNNLKGFPTEITTEYVYSATGEIVDLETPYYYQPNLTTIDITTEKVLDYDVGYANYGGLDNTTGIQSHVLQSGENGELSGDQILMVASSLPTDLKYTTYYSHTYIPDGETDPVTETGTADVVLNDVAWMYSDHVFTFNGDTTSKYYLFIADQGIQSYIENADILVDEDGHSLPLYCFVNVTVDGKTTLVFAYGQYNKESLSGTTDYVNWFSEQNNLVLQHDAADAYLGGIYGNYVVKPGKSGSGLIARVIPFNVNSSALGGETIDTTVTPSKVYKNSLVTFYTPGGNAGTEDVFMLPTAKTSVDDDNNGYLSINTRIVTPVNNKFVSEINGIKTRFSYPVEVIKLFTPISASMFVNPGDLIVGGTAFKNSAARVRGNESVVVHADDFGSTPTANNGYKNFPLYFFDEIPGTREELANGVVNYYYALYSRYSIDKSSATADSKFLNYYTINGISGQVIKFKVTVTPAADGNTMIYSLYIYDTFIAKCGGETISVSGNPYYFNLYDDCEEIAKNETKITYAFTPTSADSYYLYLNHTTENGKESFDASDAYMMIKGEMRVYNKYSYAMSGSIKQYDFSTGTFVDASELQTIKFYANPANVTTEYSRKNQEGKYAKTVVLKNNGETVAKFDIIVGDTDMPDGMKAENFPAGLTTQQFCNIVNSTGRVFKSGDSEYYVITSLSSDSIPIYQLVSGSIRFKSQRVPTSGKFVFDFKFELFGIKRLNVSWWGATGAADNETDAYYIKDGIFSIDYNFSDPQHQVNLSLQKYYLPLETNIIVLIFASILLVKVLGQAVWGIIQRIFDITLYFVILPGVASTMPIDDGSRFKTWKENVIKKVLGAYGVLIGINFFFILVPAIRSASKLFTGTDLKDNLATGNIFANVSPDFVNFLVYIMFLLVAITMIQTLPGIIAQFVNAEDVYKNGGDVKKNVDATIDKVGSAISGNDLVQGIEKTKNTFKNSVPGMAIWGPAFKTLGDSIKKAAGSGKSSEGSAADESQEAHADNQQTGEQQSAEGDGDQRFKYVSAEEMANMTPEEAMDLERQRREAAQAENAGEAGAENAGEDADKFSKDRQKLEDLEAQKEKQLNGENGTRLGFFARRKAYNQFNEGKELEDSIVKEGNKKAEDRAIKLWNREQENAKINLKDKISVDEAIKQHNKDSLDKIDINDEKAREAFIKQYNENLEAQKVGKDSSEERRYAVAGMAMGMVKDELALKMYNKAHDTNFSSLSELKVRERDKAREAFNQDQANKKAEARNNYINDRLDKKIAKQNEKIQLKEQGLYRNWFQKGAGYLTGRVMRKATEADREKLEKQKTDAQERLQKAIEAKDEKAIKREQNAINKLNDRIAQEHKGLLPFITASARSGIRRAKSNILDKYEEHKDKKISKNLGVTAKDAQEAEKNKEDFEKLVVNNMTTTLRDAAKRAGVSVDREAKFTKDQIDNMRNKYNSISTASTALNQALKDKGLTKEDLANDIVLRDKLIERAFRLNKNLNRDSMEDMTNVRVGVEKTMSDLKNKQEELQKASKDYGKEVKNAMKDNQESFARNDLMAKRTSFYKVKAERSAAINELNKLKKKRGDGPETDEEKKLISEIAGMERSLEELSHFTRFGRVKDNAKFVAGKVGGFIGHYSGVNWTIKTAAPAVGKAIGTAASAVGTAAKKTGEAIGTAAEKTGGAIKKAATKTGEAIGTATYFVGKYTGVNAIINKTRREKVAKAFIQSDEVKERTKARSAVKEEDLTRRVAERVAEKQKNTPVNVAQIRKTAKEQINDVLRNEPQRFRGAKSAGAAYYNSQEFKKFAREEIVRYQAQQNRNSAQDKRIATLEAKLARLEQIENRLKKNVKDVKTLMNDRRSAKYKVPQIKDTRNPDPKGK